MRRKANGTAMNYETSIDAGGIVDYPAGTLDGGAMDDDARPARGRRRLWIIVAVLAVLGLVGLGYMRHRASAGSDSKPAALEQTVSVIAPGRTTVARTITASGVLAARRALPVGIAGEGGRVLSVLVDAGAWVRAGQVLAVVDRSVQSQQIAGQAANIAVQRANLQLAQANLDRALKLVSKGFISRADVDRLTATRDGAAAQVKVAQASLGQLQASAARLNVVAPASGLVLSRTIEVGQIVSPGSGVLFQIAQGGELEMQARLAEVDLAQVAVGTPADVVPVGTTQTFKGAVWQIAPTIDAQTRQGIVRIALPYDRALRPGGFASTTIRSGFVTAPVLPESAIQNDQKGQFVYVVGADNKVVRRDVTLGDVTPNGIVVASGLGGLERVVLRAGGFLSPGDKVRPVAAGNGG